MELINTIKMSDFTVEEDYYIYLNGKNKVFAIEHDYEEELKEEHLEAMKKYNEVELGNNLKGSVDNLPDNITHLTIGNYYKGSLDNLPKNLKFLDMGLTYNKQIDFLPEGLEVLKLSGEFNQEINNLPKSLKELQINSGYRKNIKRIDDNIERLFIHNNNSIFLPEGKYKKLVLFEIFGNGTHCDIDRLPETVEELTILTTFNNVRKKLPQVKRLKIYTVNNKIKSESIFYYFPNLEHIDIYFTNKPSQYVREYTIKNIKKIHNFKIKCITGPYKLDINY